MRSVDSQTRVVLFKFQRDERRIVGSNYEELVKSSQELFQGL
jgi:hypothetical protein